MEIWLDEVDKQLRAEELGKVMDNVIIASVNIMTSLTSLVQ